MAKPTQGRFQTPGRGFGLLCGTAVFAMVLMSLFSGATQAQEEAATCPCFSYEEVEAMFLNGLQQAEEGGMTACQTEDYSVECNAEIVVWDATFEILAKASINWFDFDPSRCEYVDTINNPGVERSENWPHPAPEALARACLNIIASVIAKSDTLGTCTTYP